MKLTFLGTGSSIGVPQPACSCDVCISPYKEDKRLRSCVCISDSLSNIIIDSGPDFRSQMLGHNINKIDALLITHAHRDHIAGLDDVRGYNIISKKAMELYCSLSASYEIKHMFHYMFADDKHSSLPNININIIDKDSFLYINGIKISVIEARHYKMKVLGFRFNNIAYITDTNGVDTSELEKLKNLDILVLNALQQDKHISQFSLSEAIEFSNTVKPKKTFFTHIGHQMGLHKEVQEKLKANMYLAYDGLILDF